MNPSHKGNADATTEAAANNDAAATNAAANDDGWSTTAISRRAACYGHEASTTYGRTASTSVHGRSTTGPSNRPA